jgi:hypothetical protein
MRCNPSSAYLHHTSSAQGMRYGRKGRAKEVITDRDMDKGAARAGKVEAGREGTPTDFTVRAVRSSRTVPETSTRLNQDSYISV